MADQSHEERSVFLKAIEIDCLDDRLAYLREACGNNDQLQSRVKALLRAHDTSQGLLDVADAGTETVAQPLTEEPGTQIGPYELHEQIGEGGFGIVYVAEQEVPVARKVALKVIKPGMDSKEVIARFEAERQALALMSHPNVAKVLDAGATESGRPYFVMELVHGVPITDFCDEQKLSTDERLRLFVDVCRAVQHAHQKGIIHRDLKPSNVMVTVSDGRPLPKVIDFGISKALSSRLTDKTVYTAYGQMVGTPLYMSPEQASSAMNDVDTRSDVYSLGVLLYELLTGTTPFDRESLKNAGFDDLRRIICEDEPLRPSNRISTLNAELLSTVSDKRQIDARKLSRSLRGELDWIVMKALEKDRNRRYESASGLASDIERYLNDEAIVARPPSTLYRLRKYVRRNRTRLTTSTLILLVCLVAGGSFALSAWERVERLAETRGRVQSAVGEARRLQEDGDWPESLAATSRAVALLESGDADFQLRQLVDQLQTEMQAHTADREMIARLQQAEIAGLQVDVEENHYMMELLPPEYEAAFREYGIDCESMTAGDAARRILSRPADVQEELITALDHWGDLEFWLSRESRVEPRTHVWIRDLLGELDGDSWRSRLRGAIWQTNVGEMVALADSSELLDQPPYMHMRLGTVLCSIENHRDLGIAVLRRAREAHPDSFLLNHELATQLGNEIPPQYEEAVRFRQVCVALQPDNPGAWLNLGIALHDSDNTEGAIGALRKAIEISSDYAAAYNRIGNVLRDAGRLDDAMEAFNAAIDLQSDNPWYHSNLGVAHADREFWKEATAAAEESIRLDAEHSHGHFVLGYVLQHTGRADEALAEYQKAVRLDPEFIVARRNLANLYLKSGQPDAAVAELQEVVRREPTNDHHWRLGEAFSQAGRFEDAVTQYREAIRLDPDDEFSHHNLGNALRNLGEFDAASEESRWVIAHKPASPDVPRYKAWFNLGLTLSSQGRSAEAIAACEQAIQMKPDYSFAHSVLAETLANSPDARSRDLSRAVAHARQAIELDSASVDNYISLGVVLYRMSEWEQAIEALESGLSRQTIESEWNSYLSAATWFTLAMAHWQSGNSEEARQHFDHAAGLANAYNGRQHVWVLTWRFEAAVLMGIDDPHRLPENSVDHPRIAEPYVQLGDVRLTHERYAEAEAAFREALRRDPGNANLLNSLGDALCAQDRFVEAEACYGQAIDRAPNVAEFHEDSGLTLIALERYADAEDALREAVGLQPNSTRNHRNLADLLSDRGNLEGAEVEYRNAISLSPDIAALRVRLIGVLRAQEKLEEAVDACRELIPLDPDRASHHQGLGDCLSGLERYAEAEAAYREAIRLDPGQPGRWHNLAGILRAQGKVDEAVAAYRTAIFVDPEFRASHSHLRNMLIRNGRLALAADAMQYTIRLTKLADDAAQRRVQMNDWYMCAVLLLHSNQQTSYEQLCGDLLSRFGQTDDPEMAGYLTWVCTLAPVEGDAAAQSIELAEQCLTAAPDQAIDLYKLGVAHFRAGHDQRAVEWLSRAAEACGGGCAWDFLHLAMAHQRMGNTAEARIWMSRADTWCNEHLAAEDRVARLDLERIQEEAEKLISSSLLAGQN